MCSPVSHVDINRGINVVLARDKDATASEAVLLAACGVRDPFILFPRDWSCSCSSEMDEWKYFGVLHTSCISSVQISHSSHSTPNIITRSKLVVTNEKLTDKLPNYCIRYPAISTVLSRPGKRLSTIESARYGLPGESGMYLYKDMASCALAPICKAVGVYYGKRGCSEGPNRLNEGNKSEQ